MVFLDIDVHGRRIARKVFIGEWLSRCVLYALTGAPNPYGWCEPAVRAAVCRREILRLLVRYWFRDRLTVPRTVGCAWNREQRAFELAAEFVEGTHLPLRYSDSDHGDQLDELTQRIMKPLQWRLIEAGFDGLVWQAGLSNPVAANNFLLERDAGGETRWAWIDLESGVPALFPINPLALFRFYLPRSIHHGRPLFDDVDVPKLAEYLKQQQREIKRELGEEACRELQDRVAELERHQCEWKSLGRTARSLAYFLARGRITPEQADWYADRPCRWQARLLTRGMLWGVGELVERSRQAWRWFRSVDWRRAALRVGRFVVSRRFREHLARRYVAGRVAECMKRKFLSAAYARSLRREMRRDESTACVADFGVHLAIKPAVKIMAWLVLPALYLAGLIREPAFLGAIVGCGAACRTAYTTIRILQTSLSGRRRPWVALGVGLLPVLGNMAFPVQLCYRAVRERRRLAQFLLYDTFARVGRSIPIWGGAGSLLESWFNRMPDVLTRWLTGRRAARAARVPAGAAGVPTLQASAAIPKT